jgi:glycosyltransferase involved in cell wall biosynthesis
MRIIHVINNFNPVLGYQETFLAREQAKLGHEVCVITSDLHFRPDYQANKTLFQTKLCPGFYVEEGINVWRLKTLFELPYNAWLSGLERKIQALKPDIVHVHMVCTLNAVRVAMLKGKKKNFKLVIDDHMSPDGSLSNLRMLYPFFRYTFSKIIQKNADALVGVAPICKTYMHEIYGFPLEQILVIPLGADPNLFVFDPEARKQIRNEFSISEQEVVFIYAGKITPRKGPHILIKAATKLAQKHDNIRVILVGGMGSNTYVENVRWLISKGNMTDKVILHNAVPNKELYKYYSASDVAIWPRESSLSVFDANACGLPVIVSDTTEAPERVSNSNGLMYHGNDPIDLAKKMEKLIDPELREKMGKNGRIITEGKYNWAIIAKQFIDIVSTEQDPVNQ